MNETPQHIATASSFQLQPPELITPVPAGAPWRGPGTRTGDSRPAGTGRCGVARGGGSMVIARWSTSASLSPRKGRWPASIQYKVTPIDQTSARRSMGLPCICSGAM